MSKDIALKRFLGIVLAAIWLSLGIFIYIDNGLKTKTGHFISLSSNEAVFNLIAMVLAAIYTVYTTWRTK